MLNINIPLLTWSCIVTALVTAFVITIVHYAITHHNESHSKAPHRQPIFGIVTENDEFYAPGDRRVADEFDD